MTELDFIAHQLYMISCGGAYGVRWAAMREDLQQQWRTRARKAVDEWVAEEERARKARDAAFDGVRIEVVK